MEPTNSGQGSPLANSVQAARDGQSVHHGIGLTRKAGDFRLDSVRCFVDGIVCPGICSIQAIAGGLDGIGEGRALA